MSSLGASTGSPSGDGASSLSSSALLSSGAISTGEASRTSTVGTSRGIASSATCRWPRTIERVSCGAGAGLFVDAMASTPSGIMTMSEVPTNIPTPMLDIRRSCDWLNVIERGSAPARKDASAITTCNQGYQLSCSEALRVRGCAGSHSGQGEGRARPSLLSVTL